MPPRSATPAHGSRAVSFAVIEATRCSAVLTFDDDFTVAGFRRFAG
jgi:predicted nucleic acid-binding protein